MKVSMTWFDKKTQTRKTVSKKIYGLFAYNAAKKLLDSKRRNYILQIGDYMAPGIMRFVANSPDGKTSIILYTDKNQ